MFAIWFQAEDLKASVPFSSGCLGNDLLKNPYFVTPPNDFNRSISMENAEFAPENWSWGLRGYAWDTSTLALYPITECAFFSKGIPNDYDVWLYGKDDSGGIGVVTLIQGWVWQSSSPPAGWYLFSPQSVSNVTNMTVQAWIIHRGGPYPETKTDMLRNGIVDIWMRDESSGKILMMDLLFFGHSNSWKDDNIYHYAANVADVPEDTWTEVEVNVDDYIDHAIAEAANEGMPFEKKNLKIYQVEILEELRHAWGELRIGSFTFTSCSPPVQRSSLPNNQDLVS